MSVMTNDRRKELIEKTRQLLMGIPENFTESMRDVLGSQYLEANRQCIKKIEEIVGNGVYSKVFIEELYDMVKQGRTEFSDLMKKQWSL